VILGISCDSQQDNAAFRQKFSFPYDLLCDIDRKMSLGYGAVDAADSPRAKRISYLIDTQGRIKKVYAQVTPADHPDQVLTDLA
jgi:peroxiredoxin Q/BCP